jgi:hypothetical protein
MKYHDLAKITDEELIELYDEVAKHTVVGISYYMEEIMRRRADKSDKLMLKYTKWITLMTAVIFILTVVNVVAVFIK